MADSTEFTKKLYGKDQFRYSIEREMLPEGFIRYHKKNFMAYFSLSEQEFIGKRLLDTGCGPGKHAMVLAMLGADVLALDLSPDNIAKGQALKSAYGLGNLCFKVHNLMEPLAEGEFDLVSAHNWLQHAENPAAVLRNLVQSLRMGGRLYLSVYHARTFRFFISQIARSLLQQSHYDLMRQIVVSHFPTGFSAFMNPENIYMENIFDDFLVPHCITTTYDNLVRDATLLGLRPISPVPAFEHPLEAIDAHYLRMGFEKVSEPEETKQLSYTATVDEFESGREEVLESAQLAKEAIEYFNALGDPCRTAGFCLGLYRLRAEFNQVCDCATRHQALQWYLRASMDDSLRAISYFYDVARVYSRGAKSGK